MALTNSQYLRTGLIATSEVGRNKLQSTLASLATFHMLMCKWIQSVADSVKFGQIISDSCTVYILLLRCFFVAQFVCTLHVSVFCFHKPVYIHSSKDEQEQGLCIGQIFFFLAHSYCLSYFIVNVVQSKRFFWEMVTFVLSLTQ